MLRSLWFFLLFLSVSLQAQFTYVMDQTIPVKDEQGNQLALPWGGGLNAAHYNTMDLDGDGAEDLVLFDRMGDKVQTFLSRENKWHYSPEFEEFMKSNRLALGRGTTVGRTVQELKPVLSADALMNEPVRVFEVPDFRPRAYARQLVKDLHTEESSLEDIFVGLVSERS